MATLVRTQECSTAEDAHLTNALGQDLAIKMIKVTVPRSSDYYVLFVPQDLDEFAEKWLEYRRGIKPSTPEGPFDATTGLDPREPLNETLP